MHSVPRALRGLQNAPVRPRLSSKLRVTGTPWEAVRRHSVDDFVKSTLVKEGEDAVPGDAVPTDAKPSDAAPTDAKQQQNIAGRFLPKTARGQSVDDFVKSTLIKESEDAVPRDAAPKVAAPKDAAPRDAKEQQDIASQFLPKTARVVAKPRTHAAGETGSRELQKIPPNTKFPKSPQPGRPTFRKTTAPAKKQDHKDPNNLVRRTPTPSRAERQAERQRASAGPSPPDHPRVVLFEGLPTGTTSRQVVEALSRALWTGDMTTRTAVVTGADTLRPSGAVRVRFLYADGAREACEAARAGKLRIGGAPATARPLEEGEEGQEGEGHDAADANAGAAKAAKPGPWSLRASGSLLRGANPDLMSESARAALGLRSRSSLRVFRGREERDAARMGLPDESEIRWLGLKRGSVGAPDDVLPAGAKEGEATHVPKADGGAGAGAEEPAPVIGQSG